MKRWPPASSHFPQPTGRFLEQMLYGTQTSGEMKLSEVARSLGEDISLLKSSLWFVVGGYCTRWRIEESIRFIKQSYHPEDIRVHSYRRLKNLAALVVCAAYFAAVYLGESLRFQVLMRRVFKAAKHFFGVPEFHFTPLLTGSPLS